MNNDLAAFEAALDAARAKHDWTGYTLEDMREALDEELLELARAFRAGDHHGPHGIAAEALDVAVVALRIYAAVNASAVGEAA